MSDSRATMEALYNQSIKLIHENQIVSGRIVSVKTNDVLVDVGFKSEGLVPIAEFSSDDLQVGKELDFLVESIENDAGMIALSREKALRIKSWDNIVKNASEGDLIEGRPVKKVKGGYLVVMHLNYYAK